MMLSSIALAAALSLGPQAAAPHGTYVEARSATVFAGGCHFGSQYTTQGREAVLAWRFEGGAHDGVALHGASIACIVSGDKNLTEDDVRLRSVVLLDAAATEGQRAASLAWLRAHHGALLGRIVEVRPVAIDVLAADERFAVRAGEGVRITGGLLPERECCTMPYARLYDPLTPVTGALVGHTAELYLAEPVLKRRWLRTDENSAFVARFGPQASPGS